MTREYGVVLRRILLCLSATISTLVLLAGCSASFLLNVTSGGVPTAPNEGISYGSNPRQIYDLYWPEGATDTTPVIIFFYGGSWDSGRRADYAFAGNGLADEGYITAIVDYRIFPEVKFPDFVEDGAAAVARIVNDVGENRTMFLMGHSAGAQIAALLAFDQRYLATHGLDACDTLQGFIGLAGPYDFLPLKKQRLREIFPQSIRDQSQPINYVSERSPPALLIHGKDDTTVLPRNSRRLADALNARGVTSQVNFIEDLGHVKIVAALASVLQKTAPVRPLINQFVAQAQSMSRPGCQ